MRALLDFAPADSTTVQKVNGHFPAASRRRSFRLLQLQILFLEGVSEWCNSPVVATLRRVIPDVSIAVPSLAGRPGRS
jgi:hypothetical protein